MEAIDRYMYSSWSSFKVHTLRSAAAMSLQGLNLDCKHSHQLDACSVAA